MCCRMKSIWSECFDQSRAITGIDSIVCTLHCVNYFPFFLFISLFEVNVMGHFQTHTSDNTCK